MNNMIQRIRHKGTSRKGFTLPEMLIVIAIIAVLVAIAIPVLTSQMNSAKDSVDEANLRAAKSMAVAATLMKDPAPTSDSTYIAVVGATDDSVMEVVENASDRTTFPSKNQGSKKIQVVVTSTGDVKSADWVD